MTTYPPRPRMPARPLTASETMTPTRWRLTVEAPGDDIRRLRAMLKNLWRAWGVKVVAIDVDSPKSRPEIDQETVEPME